MVMLKTEGMTGEDFDGGPSNRPAPGTYHVVVDHAIDNEEKGFVEVKFTVLAGKPLDAKAGDQSGKEVSLKMHVENKDGDAAKTKNLHRQLGRFARIAGMIDDSNIGQNLNVDFSNAGEAQMIVKVEHSTFTNDNGEEITFAKIPFMGFWQIGDKDVQSIPIDADMWAAAKNRGVPLRQKADKSASNGPSNGHAKQPAMAGAAAGCGDFDDI